MLMDIVNILRNKTGNTTLIADSLSSYINIITSSNTSLDPNYILSATEIDQYVGSLNNITLSINSNTSFIMAQQPDQRTNISTLGASFTRGLGGEIVNDFNDNIIFNSDSTTAAVFNNQSFVGITSVNMFIIDQPITYENLDNSNNKTLASSVIVVAVQSNGSAFTSVNISLYFQVLDEYTPDVSAKYLCSFYDTTTAKWNESGCTTPFYNQQFNRYECSCNHLSTFALMWSPSIISCNTSTQVLLYNGTCVSKPDGQV
jgi:hypothetical protein